MDTNIMDGPSAPEARYFPSIHENLIITIASLSLADQHHQGREDVKGQVAVIQESKMSIGPQIYLCLIDVVNLIKGRIRKFFSRRAKPSRDDNEQMYEIIQRIRNELNADDYASSSSDSISSYGYEDKVSPLSSSNCSLAS